MKKFMNEAGSLAADSLDGFVGAHDDLVAFGQDRKHVRRRVLSPGKVAIIAGGGAGHEPMHVGFIGKGMLDAACTGHVFTSPTPDQILGAIRETDNGAGVLLIVKNYDGDLMNFEMAAEMAVSDGGHRIETLIVNDDIAVERTARGTGRRGVAGTLVVEKIVGAAAEAGLDLFSLKAVGESAIAATRTMGVALKGATVPQTTRETFVLGETEMEVGVGIHGEPGRSRQDIADAATIASLICRQILDDLEPAQGQRILLFVNGLGATPPSELYLMFGLARRFFEAHGLVVCRKLVGTYATSLDMAGMSITVTLLDDASLGLWDAPVHSAALHW
ncbi:dihydroxyacetone kinase subunit DhaK [Pararhizobium antarcticum]|uniref:Dihydroxyacetone kinase n=1 Tax=Pararhizobium antarcticum TaxID=1798805 RepID=A0A657LYE7_9HYPH|nr:dihydroxyacetone kinase subunit DhaK [Pararhizobium antarcticum]OJG00130.1 dihydroxyacetone kinase [Rhizobium sp. 58]OJG01467.1 dihydroxyacetone kinase [Pararhizobium antarcticum]